jgi:hypothetical protein
MIGWTLSHAYRLPSNLEEAVFAHILLKNAGFDVNSGELTRDGGVRVVLWLAHILDQETPQPIDGWEDDLYWFPWWRRDEPRRMPPPISGTELAQRCVDQVVGHLEPSAALKALGDLRPELRYTKGALKAYRPVARAALARELAKVAVPIIKRFAKQGRLTDSDRYIDEAGQRQSGPGAA